MILLPCADFYSIILNDIIYAGLCRTFSSFPSAYKWRCLFFFNYFRISYESNKRWIRQDLVRLLLASQQPARDGSKFYNWPEVLLNGLWACDVKELFCFFVCKFVQPLPLRSIHPSIVVVFTHGISCVPSNRRVEERKENTSIQQRIGRYIPCMFVHLVVMVILHYMRSGHSVIYLYFRVNLIFIIYIYI